MRETPNEIYIICAPNGEGLFVSDGHSELDVKYVLASSPASPPDADEVYQQYVKLKSDYETLNGHSKRQATELDEMKGELARANIALARNRKAGRSCPPAAAKRLQAFCSEWRSMGGRTDKEVIYTLHGEDHDRHAELRTADIEAVCSIRTLPARQDGWRDISSAPRDGSAFLGFGIHDSDNGPHWEKGDFWRAILLYDVYREIGMGGAEFVFSKDGARPWSKPTMWQPLPAPPSTPAAAMDGEGGA